MKDCFCDEDRQNRSHFYFIYTGCIKSKDKTLIREKEKYLERIHLKTNSMMQKDDLQYTEISKGHQDQRISALVKLDKNKALGPYRIVIEMLAALDSFYKK